MVDTYSAAARIAPTRRLDMVIAYTTNFLRLLRRGISQEITSGHQKMLPQAVVFMRGGNVKMATSIKLKLQIKHAETAVADTVMELEKIGNTFHRMFNVPFCCGAHIQSQPRLTIILLQRFKFIANQVLGPWILVKVVPPHGQWFLSTASVNTPKSTITVA